MRIPISFFKILLFISLLILNIGISKAQWRSLPIRSIEEYNSGKEGGEGEQFFLGFSRCLTNANYIYAGQDVCGTWRSIDGGNTWRKMRDKGLYLQYCQSIEVDPVRPNLVFVAVNRDSQWSPKVEKFEGIYRSTNGGDSWKLVLNTVVKKARKLRHLIAYSLPSKPKSKASPTRWYTCDGTSLWRSDASGDSASWMKVATIPASSIPIDIVTHPTDSKTLYIATESGLFCSTNSGESLAEVPFFKGKSVTSVLMNKNSINKIIVSIQGEGLYCSDDNALWHDQQRLQR